MQNNQPKTILLCDDDEGITDVTSIVLEDLGYRVYTVANGEDVIPTLKKYRPDLILLDLWMPIVNGEEILHQLKKNPSLSKIPVVVVSASKDTAQVAFRANADDFLCKPFDIAALEEMVKKYAGSAN